MSSDSGEPIGPGRIETAIAFAGGTVSMASMSTHRRARNLVGLAILGAFALMGAACATGAPGGAPTSSSDDDAVIETVSYTHLTLPTKA